MSPFSHIVRFEGELSGQSYFADLGVDAEGPPAPGTQLDAFRSIDDLFSKTGKESVTVRRVSITDVERSMKCESMLRSIADTGPIAA
jgi:hypothetical protein